MQDSFIPRLHPELSYKFYNIGKDKSPLLIIDNFMQDASSLIDFCEENINFNKVDTFYPGLRMAAPNMYIHAVNRYLAELLSNIFGLHQNKIAGGKALYSMVVTPPEKLEIKQCLPHVDSFVEGDLACVHYLCDLEKGGTSLYRHRKTGFEKIAVETIDYYNQVVVEEGALQMSKKAYMNGANEYFEPIAEVDAKFNRMIVYPANVLHSGNISPEFDFNPHPREGRLTLNSFIFCKRN